jgi:hypothetical protein
MENVLDTLLEGEEFDFSHVGGASVPPQTDASTTDSGGEDSFDFSHVGGVEEEIAGEPEIDTSNVHKSIRLLGVDKIKINKELKALTEVPKITAMPLTKVREILSSNKIQTIIDGTTFKGKTGNLDFNLLQNGKLIKNSQLIIYWNKDGEGYLVLNIYLS